MDDVHAFYLRVGIISVYEDLEWLGLETKGMFCGSITERQVHLLHEFCEKNPGYHIVTMTATGQMENRYVPGQGVYKLAEGDPNPHLVLNPFLHKSVDLFTEEVLDKARAMLAEIDGGNKSK